MANLWLKTMLGNCSFQKYHPVFGDESHGIKFKKKHIQELENSQKSFGEDSIPPPKKNTVELTLFASWKVLIIIWVPLRNKEK